MMQINRRGFLSLTTAAGFLAASPLRASLLGVVLWGDGLHDDTAALQALLDGGSVIAPRKIVAANEGGAVYLRHGFFVISDTLHFGRAVQVDIRECTFWAIADKPMLGDIAPAGGFTMTECELISAAGLWPTKEKLAEPVGSAHIFRKMSDDMARRLAV